MIFTANVVWIPADFGGRSHLPAIGLRPSIRFQRHIKDWLDLNRDVEVVDLNVDPRTWSGTAVLRFTIKLPVNSDHIYNGASFELLDAYRVIGVGKVLSVSANENVDTGRS